MAHFPNAGRAWYNGLTDISSALQDFDAKAKKTINGVTGDAAIAGPISTPTTPILISGEGLSIQKWPAWNAAQVIARKVSPLRYYFAQTLVNTWQMGVYGTVSGLGMYASSSKLWVPITPELIDASRIVGITAYFRIDAGHAYPPPTYPSLYVERKNLVTGASENLSIGGSHTYPDPGSGAAYRNGGVPNVFTIVPNNSGSSAVVDLSTYAYAIGFISDGGTNAGTLVVTGFEVSMSNINDQRQP